MRSKLDFAEDFGSAVGDTISTRLEEIVTVAADTSQPPADRIHTVRKKIKQLRALLRLIRSALPEYARANAGLRDAARVLSPLRDAAVRETSIEWLRAEGYFVPDMLSAARVNALLTQERPSDADQEERLARFLDNTRSLAADHRLWVTGRPGWSAVPDCAARTYKRARKTLKRARKTGLSTDLHEWRKRVKYHRHHLKLLKPVLPDGKAERQHLTELGDVLGLHHDLEALLLHVGAKVALPQEETVQLADAIRSAQADLSRLALAMGADAFAEKPGALRKRLATALAECAPNTRLSA